MQITRVAGRLVRVEPTVHWSDAIHSVPHLEYVFAEVWTDEVLTGVGYSYTHFGGNVILDMIQHTLAPELIGVDVNEATGILERLLDWLHPLGQSGVSSLAIAALDTAVWDLRGKIANLPLYKLLGARRNDVQAYGSSIDLHLSVKDQLQRISGFLEEGYTAIKIKAGREHASDDIKHFRAVRDLVGPDVKVMVDANQRWTPAEAIRRARLYEEFDLAWLEEPVRADNVEGHAAVKATMRFPLATGETVFSVRTCVDLVEKQGTDILQADIARVGGLTQWLKVATVAEVHGIPMAPHYIPEQSIHALCAVPNALIVECIQGGTLTDFGLLLEPVKPIRGRMSPPSGPGLGLHYNPSALNDRTIARFGQSMFDAATSISRE